MIRNALILAGGNGTRMNRCNKALLQYDHRTFLEKIVNSLKGFEKIYLSLNSAQTIDFGNLVPVLDSYIGIGPISGLYEGLKKSDTDELFVVPCDCPNISEELVEYIYTFLSSDYDAFLVRDKRGFIHPLMGIYSKKVLKVLEKSIEEKNYKILNILKKIKVKYVDLKYTTFDGDTLLMNINTPEDYKEIKKSSIPFIAISGVKNSGKTTLIVKLLKKLKGMGYRVGTIKHDGHDFQMDNLDSDTDRHLKSGAQATLIFSKTKFMFLKKEKEKDIEEYLSYFKGYDLVLLEGFKSSSFPKIEIIRDENSKYPICNKNNLLFYVTDKEEFLKNNSMEAVHIDEIDEILNKILKYLNWRI